MEIKSTIKSESGEFSILYRDINSVAGLEGRTVRGVHAYCFYGDQMVIVYAGKKETWTPPGGSVELGETVEEAVAREVLEETNMRVLKQQVIGFQDISGPQQITTQTRSVCIVEPVGSFLADADAEGDITEIKFIDPADIKKYFDWGEIGNHILARALEIKKSLV